MAACSKISIDHLRLGKLLSGIDIGAIYDPLVDIGVLGTERLNGGFVVRCDHLKTETVLTCRM